MSNQEQDIKEMLDVLGLTESSQKFDQMLGDPSLGSYSPVQFLREVLQPQYESVLNSQFTNRIAKSCLLETGARVENLKTGNGRIYNATTVQQILSFRFAEDHRNVGVYGAAGVGKSYFLAAVCVEACRRNYSCRFVDYCDLLDELITLDKDNDKTKYRKKLRYYARYDLLFIDDFGISRYNEEGMKILYHLIKTRNDLHKSILFSSQYSPDEWDKCLGMDGTCYGKVGSIRSKLAVGGYTLVIESAKTKK